MYVCLVFALPGCVRRPSPLRGLERQPPCTNVTSPSIPLPARLALARGEPREVAPPTLYTRLISLHPQMNIYLFMMCLILWPWTT